MTTATPIRGNPIIRAIITSSGWITIGIITPIIMVSIVMATLIKPCNPRSLRVYVMTGAIIHPHDIAQLAIE